MKSAFLTEMNWYGKVPENHSNMRTEFCWMKILEADHFNIHAYEKVRNYDVIFIIIPKGDYFLNCVGAKLKNGINQISSLLASNFTEILKNNNKKLCFIQEGSTTLFNNWELSDQFHYYNHFHNFDIIFAHNEYDVKYYKGMFPSKKVNIIPTLMLDNSIKSLMWEPKRKVILVGNFAEFYGGIQNYIISNEFEDCEKWVMTSHCRREGEEQIDKLHHFNRLLWLDWIKELRFFSYGIFLMPIIAAGTFPLNCGYFGIVCLGNEKVDTQKYIFPECSVDVNDLESSRKIANRLYEDKEYYKTISNKAKELTRQSWHVNTTKWLEHMEKVING